MYNLTCSLVQIASIEDIPVRDLDHYRVVKIFQQRDKLKLTVIPAEELYLVCLCSFSMAMIY